MNGTGTLCSETNIPYKLVYLVEDLQYCEFPSLTQSVRLLLYGLGSQKCKACVVVQHLHVSMSDHYTFLSLFSESPCWPREINPATDCSSTDPLLYAAAAARC